MQLGQVLLRCIYHDYGIRSAFGAEFITLYSGDMRFTTWKKDPRTAGFCHDCLDLDALAFQQRQAFKGRYTPIYYRIRISALFWRE